MAQEKSFENRLKAYLENRGSWYIKYWAGSKFTKSGIPDILVCDNGDFLAIEVKAKRGKPTLLQLITLKKIRESGGYGLLLYPQDFSYFKEFMDNKHIRNEFYLYNLEKQRNWEKQLKEDL